MRKFLQIALVAGLSLADVGGGPPATEMDEYRVKALFLYNFTQFIEWPQEAFKDVNVP